MNKSLIAALVLGIAILVFRFVPISANFTPILALCMAVGYASRGSWYGFVIPMLAMFVADMQFGLYAGWAFTYIPLVAIVAIGKLSKPRVVHMAGLGISSSVVFFIVSNFGVWLSTGLYPQTAAGLWLCYLAGIEFFHQTLLSTLLFSAVLFIPMFGALNFADKRVTE